MTETLATDTPAVTMDIPIFPTPEGYQCAGDLTLEWPVIDQAFPDPARAGMRVELSGHGGALRCGNFYDESSRDFDVFLNSDVIGSINCYVNHCEGEIELPGELVSGTYEIFVGFGIHYELEIEE